MTDIPYRTALIVGAGPGLSASLARGLAAAGLRVGLGARNVDKLTTLAAETGAETFAVDASKPAAVARLFEDADTRLGSPMSSSTTPVRAHIARSPNSIRKRFGRPLRYRPMAASSWSSGWARPMIRHGRGAIRLTAASASVKGYPSLQPLRRANLPGVVWRRARAHELGPKGIHVAHFVIDGGVRSARRPDPADRPNSTLDPDGIDQTYLGVLRQPRRP